MQKNILNKPEDFKNTVKNIVLIKDVAMKNIFIFNFLFFASTVCFSETWETKTVMTEEGRKSFTVRTDLYLIEQTSIHVDTNHLNVEAWAVLRKSYCSSENNDWSDWMDVGEFPVNYFTTNDDLMNIVQDIRKFASIVEIAGVRFLGVWSKNNNREFWWEDRKYIMTQRLLYGIR